ncbi:MAG: ribonuclease H-like domain-containing protein [Candidatus Paceibacterota bacterium]|jgi:hypothetical protein
MKKINTGGLKVLLVDFETAPNRAWVWGKYEQDVIDYDKETYILSFSYKWLGEKRVYGMGLCDYAKFKKDPEDDFDLVKDVYKIWCQADIIIAHNGDDFDIKVANAAFIRNGFTPPNPVKTIDTKKIAKSKFKFNSNKLDDLGNRLGLGRKVETGGFKLWKGCMEGNKSAWKKMIRYNKNDVILLEKVYLKIRPWATNHPNMNIMADHNSCSSCNSKNIEQRGWTYTAVSRRKKFVCKDCGKWSSGRVEKLENINLR